MSTAARAPRRAASSLQAGLGQMVVSDDPGDILVVLGLGSCIGLVMHDPRAAVGGLAHVMLPGSEISDGNGPEAKFADTAVPALLDAVVDRGADRGRLIVKMAGGAQMFSAGSGKGALGIGARNGVAVRAALDRAGLKLAAADTGGNSGRTVEVEVGSGTVRVRLVGAEAAEL